MEVGLFLFYLQNIRFYDNNNTLDLPYIKAVINPLPSPPPPHPFIRFAGILKVKIIKIYYRSQLSLYDPIKIFKVTWYVQWHGWYDIPPVAEDGLLVNHPAIEGGEVLTLRTFVGVLKLKQNPLKIKVDN